MLVDKKKKKTTCNMIIYYLYFHYWKTIYTYLEGNYRLSSDKDLEVGHQQQILSKKKKYENKILYYTQVSQPIDLSKQSEIKH